jgi:hypothetical protein
MLQEANVPDPPVVLMLSTRLVPVSDVTVPYMKSPAVAPITATGALALNPREAEVVKVFDPVPIVTELVEVAARAPQPYWVLAHAGAETSRSTRPKPTNSLCMTLLS